MAKNIHDFLNSQHATGKKAGIAEVQRQEVCDGA